MSDITFAMIKNDAVRNGVDRDILTALSAAGFLVIANTPRQLKLEEALMFYAEHIGRPYFADLMCSIRGTVVPLVLEYVRPNGVDTAVTALRNLIGINNGRLAEPHTIRARFGGHLFDPDAPVAANAIHASDSEESVLREIGIMFPMFNIDAALAQSSFTVAHAPVAVPDKAAASL